MMTILYPRTTLPLAMERIGAAYPQGNGVRTGPGGLIPIIGRGAQGQGIRYRSADSRRRGGRLAGVLALQVCEVRLRIETSSRDPLQQFVPGEPASMPPDLGGEFFRQHRILSLF